ncbi:hypothetical protein ACLB2K_056572 [Fragaria x ananassa]
MAETTLPVELIVLILTWLPVKSLIRFTCVSKRFRSIILSDPKFAKSQLRAAHDRKTLTQRFLYSPTVPELESLDLDSPSFDDCSSLRKHKLPLDPADSYALPLGSCNGIVFLAFDDNIIYTWNPSTGFLKKLPDPGFSRNGNELILYGVGYLSATDDYRVFVVSADYENDKEVAMFSSRAKAWKTLEVDFDESCFCSNQGILLHEALHWLDTSKEIVAFNLGQEKHKFRKMLLPLDFNDGGGDYYENHLGVSAGGYLSLARNLYVCGDCIDIWVMGEYGVLESWNKRFNLKFSDPHNDDIGWKYNHVLVLETGVFWNILQNEEDKCSMYEAEGHWLHMIQYQESTSDRGLVLDCSLDNRAGLYGRIL